MKKILLIFTLVLVSILASAASRPNLNGVTFYNGDSTLDFYSSSLVFRDCSDCPVRKGDWSATLLGATKRTSNGKVYTWKIEFTIPIGSNTRSFTAYVDAYEDGTLCGTMNWDGKIYERY